MINFLNWVTIVALLKNIFVLKKYIPKYQGERGHPQMIQSEINNTVHTARRMRANVAIW